MDLGGKSSPVTNTQRPLLGNNLLRLRRESPEWREVSSQNTTQWTTAPLSREGTIESTWWRSPEDSICTVGATEDRVYKVERPERTESTQWKSQRMDRVYTV